MHHKCYLSNFKCNFSNQGSESNLKFSVKGKVDWSSEYIKGKSFSEALILASTNPQYDKRLIIELQVQYMKIARSEYVVITNCYVFILTLRTIFVHNMF